jgi:alpha-glucosidase
VIQNTTQKSLDPLTLLVCLDRNGRAEGRLYEDSGDGFEYKRGEYLLTKYSAKLDGKVLTVSAKSRKGKLGIPKREIVVKVVMDGKVVEKKIKEYDGFAAKIKL